MSQDCLLDLVGDQDREEINQLESPIPFQSWVLCSNKINVGIYPYILDGTGMDPPWNTCPHIENILQIPIE